MKRKTKYKGVIDPGKIPNTRTDNSDSEMEPDYVKKYYPHKNRTATQLKLFGNPYEKLNEFD